MGFGFVLAYVCLNGNAFPHIIIHQIFFMCLDFLLPENNHKRVDEMDFGSLFVLLLFFQNERWNGT